MNTCQHLTSHMHDMYMYMYMCSNNIMFLTKLIEWTLNYECSVGQPLVTRLLTALNTRPESLVYYDWSNCKSTTPNVNQEALSEQRALSGRSIDVNPAAVAVAESYECITTAPDHIH